MSSPAEPQRVTRQCPKCGADILPAMARCRRCGETRPLREPVVSLPESDTKLNNNSDTSHQLSISDILDLADEASVKDVDGSSPVRSLPERRFFRHDAKPDDSTPVVPEVIDEVQQVAPPVSEGSVPVNSDDWPAQQPATPQQRGHSIPAGPASAPPPSDPSLTPLLPPQPISGDRAAGMPQLPLPTPPVNPAPPVPQMPAPGMPLADSGMLQMPPAASPPMVAPPPIIQPVMIQPMQAVSPYPTAPAVQQPSPAPPQPMPTPEQPPSEQTDSAQSGTNPAPPSPGDSGTPFVAGQEEPQESTDKQSTRTRWQQLKQVINTAAKKIQKTTDTTADSGRRPSGKLKRLAAALESMPSADLDKLSQTLLAAAKTGDPQAFGTVAPFANDGNARVRTAAAEALGEIQSPRALPTLLRLLADKNQGVRTRAIGGLGKAGEPLCVTPLVLCALADPAIRPHAVKAIAGMEGDTIAPLRMLAGGKDIEVALLAVMTIGKVGGETAEQTLLRLLSSEQPRVRAGALDMLSRQEDTKINKRALLGHLRTALADQEPTVRRTAAMAIGRFGHVGAAKELVAALQDPHGQVRSSALRSLGELADQKTVKAIAPFLNDHDPAMQQLALEALSRIGDKSVASQVVGLVGSPDAKVRANAVAALKKLGDAGAVPRLTELTGDFDPAVRRQAVETLGRIGHKSAIEPLMKILKRDTAHEVRAAAAHAMGDIGDKSCLEALEDALNDESIVRCQAVMAIGNIGEASAAPALMAMLRDAAAEVRYHALGSIAKIGHIENLQAVTSLLDDPEPMVQRGAQKALEILDPKGEVRKVRRAAGFASKLAPSALVGAVPRGLVGGIVVAIAVGAAGAGIYFGIGATAPAHADVPRGTSFAAALSHDGSMLIAARSTGLIEVWNVEAERIEAATRGGTTRFVTFNPEGSEVVFTSGTELQQWSFRNAPVPVAVASDHQQAITRFHVSHDGTTATTVSDNGQVGVWELAAGKSSRTFNLPGIQVLVTAMSPDGTMFAGGSRAGFVAIYSIDTGEEVVRFVGAPDDFQRKTEIGSLAFSPDNLKLAVGTRDGRIVVWDLEKGDKHSEHRCPGKRLVATVRFSPDGKRIASGDHAGNTLLWTLEDGNRKRVTGLDAEKVDTVQFSADGRTLIVANDEDSPVWLVDVATGSVGATLDKEIEF